MYGYPYRGDSRGYDDARRLVRRILEALYDRGRVLQASADLCKKEGDKGVFVHLPFSRESALTRYARFSLLPLGVSSAATM